MATSPTQIRIDENTKQQAVELLEGLGLSLSDAMEEAKLLSRNPNTKKYTSFSEALEELDI